MYPICLTTIIPLFNKYLLSLLFLSSSIIQWIKMFPVQETKTKLISFSSLLPSSLHLVNGCSTHLLIAWSSFASLSNPKHPCTYSLYSFSLLLIMCSCFYKTSKSATSHFCTKFHPTHLRNFAYAIFFSPSGTRPLPRSQAPPCYQI